MALRQPSCRKLNRFRHRTAWRKPSATSPTSLDYPSRPARQHTEKPQSRPTVNLSRSTIHPKSTPAGVSQQTAHNANLSRTHSLPPRAPGSFPACCGRSSYQWWAGSQPTHGTSRPSQTPTRIVTSDGRARNLAFVPIGARTAPHSPLQPHAYPMPPPRRRPRVSLYHVAPPFREWVSAAPGLRRGALHRDRKPV